MSVNALLGVSNNSNYLYSITRNLLAQSTSMDSRIYSAVQQMSSSNSSTSSSETTEAAYTSIDSFLKTYQSDLNELNEASENLMLSNRQGIFSQYEKGKADLDDVVSAVEKFVDSYNSVVSLLKDNESRGTGTASHLASFARGVGNVKTFDISGYIESSNFSYNNIITYDKDGKMVLDSEALKKSLEEDYDTTSSLIGGQYGIADRAAAKADQALGDSVQRIVNNDLNSLISNTQNFNSIQYTYNFSRAGVYNLSNMYAVGLFVNTMA